MSESGARQRRVCAAEALRLLQDIAEDQSGDEQGEDVTDDDISFEDVQQNSVEEVSDYDTDDSEIANARHQEGNQCTSTASVDRNVDLLVSKNGTVWRKTPTNNESTGRVGVQNVFRCKSGPVSAAVRKIDATSQYSALSLLIDEKMLRHIQKCTEAEGKRVLGEWSLTLEELEKFIGLLYARGVLGCRNIPVDYLWSNTWGVPIFKDTMSRNRFKEILRFLRFDVRNERVQKLQQDKFALISDVWNDFASNCSKYYIPSCELTVDEQLFPTKSRCQFTQFMGNKPDKYGIKFWLLAEVESKYCCAVRPYLGKDDARPANVPLA